MSSLVDSGQSLRDAVRSSLLQQAGGSHWTGELSASALSTAIAAVALRAAGSPHDQAALAAGIAWLILHQNLDGSWGDTCTSLGNLSTTVLVWAALGYAGQPDDPAQAQANARAQAWISARTGGLDAARLAPAVEARYLRIARDDRHLEVVKRVSRPVTKRMFPTWAMRDDPARSWMWTAKEISEDALDRAAPLDFIAVFGRLAAEVD